jgi:hypothetical protein
MILTIGAVALGLLIAWLLGGFLLRAVGAVLILSGIVGLVVLGEGGGILVAGIGAGVWLAGHWHYALRHQEYKSALARQIFCRWAPAWLDPTRGWAIPIEAGERRRSPK